MEIFLLPCGKAWVVDVDSGGLSLVRYRSLTIPLPPVIVEIVSPYCLSEIHFELNTTSMISSQQHLRCHIAVVQMPSELD